MISTPITNFASRAVALVAAFISVLAFSASFILPMQAFAAGTLYVDSSATGTSPDGSAGNPYPTIQAAVAAASAGDTIDVAAGTYNGDITPVVDDLTIAGTGSVVLDLGSGYGINLDNAPDVATDFTLSGFTVNASPSTTYAVKAYKADGLTLTNDTFNGGAGNTGGGVDINTTNNVTFNNVTSSGFHKNGFADTAAYEATDTAGSGITFNGITASNDGWTGISFYTVGNAGGAGNIDDVTFTGTNTLSNDGAGMFIEGDTDANYAANNPPAYTITTDGTTLNLSTLAFNNNTGDDIVNYQTDSVNASDATFNGQTGDQMTPSQQTAENAKISSYSPGSVTYYSAPVTVTVDAYVNGQQAAVTNTAGVSFPMHAVFPGGEGDYSLSTTGDNNPSPYMATTADMPQGSNYSTYESAAGAASECSVSFPFKLSGYGTGATLADAEAATPTSTVPSFTNLTTDEFVVASFVDCPPVTTPDVAPTATFVFPAPGPAATSFQVVYSEPVNSSDATNPANYFLQNYPGAGGSGPLTGNATVTYDAPSNTATVTLTTPGWAISPEQEWGVTNVHDIAGTDISPDPTTAYSTPLVPPTAPGSPTTASPTASTSQTWTWSPATAPDAAVDGSASDITSYSYAVTNDADNSTTTDWTNIGNVTTETTALPVGSYTFHVKATDTAGNTGPESTGSVIVTSGAATSTLTATAQNVTATEDTPLAITLSGSGGDGSALTYTVVTNPTNGTLTGTAPDLTYTPAASSTASDSFTFTVSDDNATSTPATIAITTDASSTGGTGGGTGTPPVVNDQSVSVPENSSSTPITLTSNTSGTLTYSIVTQPTHGTLSAVSGATVSYTPTTDYSGGDSFTFKANNGQDSNVGTVSVMVTPNNTATSTATSTDPVLDATPDLTVTQGTQTTFTAHATASNASDTLEYNLLSGPTGAAIASSTGVFTWDTTGVTPGTYDVAVQAEDTTLGSESNVASSTITVTSINPIATNSGGGGGGGGQILPGTVTTTSSGSPGSVTTTTGTGGQVLGASTYNFATDLTIGSTGEDVTQLQLILIAAGYLNIAVPTGYFGSMTQAAVMQFQSAHNIFPVMGYVGPITRAVLNAGNLPTRADESASMNSTAGIQAQLATLEAELAQEEAATGTH